MNGVDTVLRFVGAVNNKDLDALVSLMTPDHRFIDSGGMEVIGRDEMRDGWIGYFRIVPDYRIEVCETFSSEDADVPRDVKSRFRGALLAKASSSWHTVAKFRRLL